MKTDLSFQPPRRFLPPRVPSPRLSENVASKAEPDTLMVAYLESLAGCRLLRAIVQATVVLSMQPSGNHITRHLEAAETPESVSLKLSYTVSLITLSVLEPELQVSTSQSSSGSRSWRLPRTAHV